VSVVISLLQYISRCDSASLLGDIWKAHAPTRFVRLVSGLLGPIPILRLGVLLTNVLKRTCSQSSEVRVDVVAGLRDQVGIICISF